MYSFHGLHSELQLPTIPENQTQKVTMHLKLWKVYVCNALSTTTNTSRSWNRVILWMKNEWIYEWMDVLSQKAFKAEGSRVSERWGFLFLILRKSDLLWGFYPIKKAKAQSGLGIPSLRSPSKTISPPFPTNTHIQYIQDCCWPGKNRGNAIPLITPWSQRLWRAHMCSTLVSEGSQKGEKQKNHYRWIWKHRAWTTWVFHHNGAQVGFRAKKDLVYIVNLSWYHHVGVIVLAKLPTSTR